MSIDQLTTAHSLKNSLTIQRVGGVPKEAGNGFCLSASLHLVIREKSGCVVTWGGIMAMPVVGWLVRKRGNSTLCVGVESDWPL